MFLIFLISSFVKSSPIDLQINDDGFLFIPNGTVPGIFGYPSIDSGFNLMLSISSASRIHISPDYVHGSIYNGSIFTANGLLLTSARRPAILELDNVDVDCEDGNPVSVGIGPGSSLLESYGSISVLKNSLQLIFGDNDLRVFNASCVEETIARLPFTHLSGLYTADIQYKSRRGNSAVSISGLVTGLGDVMTVPASIGLDIVRTILSTGAVRLASDSFIFTPCDCDRLLGILPSIEFHVNETGASIVVFPDDFMLFDVEGDQCSFKYAIEGEYDQSMTFNPLMIPNVNVHIRNDEVIFCDSQ